MTTLSQFFKQPESKKTATEKDLRDEIETLRKERAHYSNQININKRTINACNESKFINTEALQRYTKDYEDKINLIDNKSEIKMKELKEILKVK